MSLKYVLAEQAGLKFQPRNGWRNTRAQASRRSATVALGCCEKWQKEKADKGLVCS